MSIHFRFLAKKKTHLKLSDQRVYRLKIAENAPTTIKIFNIFWGGMPRPPQHCGAFGPILISGWPASKSWLKACGRHEKSSQPSSVTPFFFRKAVQPRSCRQLNKTKHVEKNCWQWPWIRESERFVPKIWQERSCVHFDKVAIVESFIGTKGHQHDENSLRICETLQRDFQRFCYIMD